MISSTGFNVRFHCSSTFNEFCFVCTQGTCCLHMKSFFLSNDISSTCGVSFLILHPTEIQILWSQTETDKKRKSLKNRGTSTRRLINHLVLGNPVREHQKKKKKHTRNKNCEKNTKRMKTKEFRDEAGYKRHKKKEHVLLIGTTPYIL